LFPPFPCPFNTTAFGYSTARRFAISACTAIAKDHPFAETPSSFIQHVKELSLLKFVLLLQDTSALSWSFYIKIKGKKNNSKLPHGIIVKIIAPQNKN